VTRVKSGAVNPAGEQTATITAMMCGADFIDGGSVLRADITPRVFDEMHAPSTLGIFFCEFSFGYANQLTAASRALLATFAQSVPLLAGIGERAFLEIDSMLRTVHGRHNQLTSFGHAKDRSPQITTLSTAPGIAKAWLRSGRPRLRSRGPSAQHACRASSIMCAATRRSAQRR
jgi:hypothetical protein